MSKSFICDRCGQKLTRETKVYKILSGVDLCGSCWTKFNDWLNTKDKGKGRFTENMRSGLERMGEMVKEASNNVDENIKKGNY